MSPRDALITSELIFKEWKSYANLRSFDTTNAYIAEGLIWASLLVSILKRFLAHAAQDAHAVAISTRRSAMCLSPWLRQLASAIDRQQGDLYLVVKDTLAYLAINAPREPFRLVRRLPDVLQGEFLAAEDSLHRVVRGRRRGWARRRGLLRHREISLDTASYPRAEE